MMMMMMMILKICVLRRCQGVQQPMTMPTTNIADSNAWNSLHNSENTYLLSPVKFFSPVTEV